MAIPSDLEALNPLRSIEPPLWLAPATSLAETARAAAQHIFSVLRPHVPKSPFDGLLVNGFDAEQIWQQIDLQSQPLLSGLRRDIRKYEKNPEEIAKIAKCDKSLEEIEKIGNVVDDSDDMDVESFYDDDEEEDGEGQEMDEGGEEMESDEADEENEKGRVVEDGFLKIKELEEFIVDDVAREYGLETKKKRRRRGEKQEKKDDSEEEDDEVEWFWFLMNWLFHITK